MRSMLAPPQSIRSAMPFNAGNPALLVRWLYGVAAMIVLMVIVGGITRLTESGLSITEWQPVSGAIPPLTPADWEAAFAHYRTTTEYQAVNRGMSLADFQFIFFWEWAHRLLGRLIGVAFAVPLAWFAIRRMVPSGYGLRLVALLGLGGLQGVIGWWMVQSGLSGRTDVSHYRLAVHLCLALFILGATIWTARDLAALHRRPAAAPARLHPAVIAALAILIVQLFWGAFTAGLRAGYAFSSWPLMGDSLFPAGVPMLAPWAANLIDNPIVVQFIHRWWAFAAAGAMLWLGIRAMRAPGATAADRRAAMALHGLIILQILLGIGTLMSGVALWIAVAHQGVAALVVVCAAWCSATVGRPVAVSARPITAPSAIVARSPGHVIDA